MYLNTQYCKHVQSEFKAPNSEREMFNNKQGSTETMLAKQFLDLIDYQKNLLTPEEMQCYYNEYSSKIIARVVEKRTLHETMNQYRSTDCGSVFSAPYAGSIRNFPVSNNLVNRPDVLPKQINKHNRTYNNNNNINNDNSENEEVETNNSSNEEDLFIPSRGKNNYNQPVPGRSTTSQRKVVAQVHMNDTVASRTRNARRKVRNDNQIPDVVPISMRNKSPIKGKRKVINGYGKKPEQMLYVNPGVPKGASTPIVTAAASKKTRNVHLKNHAITQDSEPKRKQATKKPIDSPSRNDELDSDVETLSVFG